MKKVKLNQKVHFYDRYGSAQDAVVIKKMKKNKVVIYSFGYAQHSVPLIGRRYLIPVDDLKSGWTSVYTKGISRSDLAHWISSAKKLER